MGKPSTMIWSSLESPPPRRKSKGKLDPLEGFEPYLALRAIVLSGRMKPMEERGIFLRPGDFDHIIMARGKTAGQPMKYPARVAADRLKRTIREAGLDADFHVTKYETDTPGVWFVKVRYEPPLAHKKSPRD